ncbi:hypothetical protein MLD38_017478 [Melastoma candidum]|uniref:Uncharacterized protein n=1 Tax=Melastoma candidum TaxID=119954 RepID=A0ACB9QSN8_9MYRT|nr:hypothetical protein MLD38_017478 [Melastoma candidum]
MIPSSSPIRSPRSYSRSRRRLTEILSVSLIIMALLVSLSTAARLGATRNVIAQVTGLDSGRSDWCRGCDRKKVGTTSFRHRGVVFGYLPKGSWVPPSGPSPRHNSVVDSTQN